MMPIPRLYYSPEACSLAAHIALEETGEAFEPVRVALADGEQRSAAYLAINPKGRVPVLVDNGFVVTELPAILLYIARRFPHARLWPEDVQDQARCAEWIAWCASGLHETFGHLRRPERFADSDAARREVADKGRASSRVVWEGVERKLASSHDPWAAGTEYSVADACLLTFWIWGRAKTLQYDMPRDFPVWTALAKRIAQRDAVRRALEREALPLP
ncbi:glutathione S-transferase family protein [Burkholderia sp. 22PA0099]|uniref:glutathione S-transferase family protein n=1 Tax=Burkholderia sp. 22PA0099 TaxID=3237372 RepID=UPI0039C291B1